MLSKPRILSLFFNSFFKESIKHEHVCNILCLMCTCSVCYTLKRPKKLSTTCVAISDESEPNELHFNISMIDLYRGVYILNN